MILPIYLPIAEISVDGITLLLLGALTGILSGLFGVGGGFLMTPFLIFIGIPPSVAVASSANQIIAASFSGCLAHWRRQQVDLHLGTLLIIGGIIGSSLGVWLFALLQAFGQIDLVIAITYILFLGTVGLSMAYESLYTIFRKKRPSLLPSKPLKQPLLLRLSLPWVMYFPHTNLSMSALIPLILGFIVGILVSLMGVGGGFLLVPALIYFIGIPTSIVIGTTLFQIMFVTANVTLLQAMTTHTVDIVLAIIMICGAVIGAQYGTRLGMRLPAEYIRVFLAILILTVVFRLAAGLFMTPMNPFNIRALTP